jgi:hypothetical protein
MAGFDTTDAPASALHELRQSLNVMRLTAGNIGLRITPALNADDAAYLRNKLAIIEMQIGTLATLCERICKGPDAPANRGERHT